jgi:hypothetical protein
MENKLNSILKNNFDLPESAINLDESELLEILAQQVLIMLEQSPDQLMSMLYRLDVEERKILPVMKAGAEEPVHYGLARLVLERQKQRVATKSEVKINPFSSDMDDWAW